jgi:hypothetical protein
MDWTSCRHPVNRYRVYGFSIHGFQIKRRWQVWLAHVLLIGINGPQVIAVSSLLHLTSEIMAQEKLHR